MSSYTTVFCDGCRIKHTRGPRARHARKIFLAKWGGMTFVQPGSRDYCQVCVNDGLHLSKPKRLVYGKAKGKA